MAPRASTRRKRKTMTPTPTQLAHEFCRVLSEWLSPDELAEINRLNVEEANPNICHTGDFCDSNQALLDAMEVFGIDGFDQSLIPLCNETWKIARVAGFDPNNIPPESPAVERGSKWTDADGNRVVVDKASTEEVEFHREGGGWMAAIPTVKWLELFKSAEAVDALAWRAAAVTLENDEVYPCYLRGDKWNGWECPRFDRETVDRLLRECGHSSRREGHSVIIPYDGEDAVYPRETISLDGRQIEAWAIGAGSWTWSEEERQNVEHL